MYHNFTFVENGTTHYIQWNPTSVEFGKKERTIFETLDGPPIIHYQDTTEVLGIFIWENVPVYWRSPYTQIENLVGKSGVLRTNMMPQLVGYKNTMPYSHLGDVLSSGQPWGLYCSGTYNSDSSCLGPDGVSLVTLYTTDVASTNPGCYHPTTGIAPFNTFHEHTVLSCYVKYGGSLSFGINLHKFDLPSYNHLCYFFFDSPTELRAATSSTATDFGIDSVPGTDEWFRVWIYVHSPTSKSGYDLQDFRFIPYLYPNASWSPLEIAGTYMTDIQIEHGVTKPTWFARTDGTIISEPLYIEFLDLQTEYQDNPGTVKHTLTLNFKLTGEWV